MSFADVWVGWFTVVSWTTVGAAIFALSVVGVHFAPAGSSVALWWPAAGVSVWFALINPRERRLAVFALVLVSSGLANAVAGRSFWMALGFGVANASEAWVVAALLQTGPRRLQLDSAGAGLRFLLSVAVGALVIAVIGGGIVAVNGGDFKNAAVGLAVSHASTVILIASFALLPPRLPAPASLPEIVVQALALLVVAYFAFRPGRHLPLAFTPYPLLAWAAFRAPIRVVLTEVLAVSSIALVFTLGGWGPFGAATLTINQTVGLLELFLVSLASIGIILGGAHYEMRAVSRAMAETTQMLSSGVVEAQVGMLIVGPVTRGRLVLWRNPAALLLLEDELTGDLWEGPVADAADEARASGQQVDVRVGAGRVVSVTAHTLLDDAGRRQPRFAVQMVDVTESLRAMEMQLAAAHEKAEALTARADLERQRDDFVATTSHELRTPVTSIVGYAELLAEGESLGALEQRWVEIISRNAHRLSELVEDLLTLGRAAQGHPSRLAQTVPLAALVSEAVAAAGVLAHQRTDRGHGCPRGPRPDRPRPAVGRQPDADQPHLECPEVHRRGRARHGDEPRRRTGHRARRARQRTRHDARCSRPRVRALLPGAGGRAGQHPRHRPRPADRRRARGPQQRHDRAHLPPRGGPGGVCPPTEPAGAGPGRARERARRRDRAGHGPGLRPARDPAQDRDGPGRRA